MKNQRISRRRAGPIWRTVMPKPTIVPPKPPEPTGELNIIKWLSDYRRFKRFDLREERLRHRLLALAFRTAALIVSKPLSADLRYSASVRDRAVRRSTSDLSRMMAEAAVQPKFCRSTSYIPERLKRADKLPAEPLLSFLFNPR